MDTNPQQTCHHVKTNGNLCQALVMAGTNFCYFHLRDRKRHDNIRRAHNFRIARLNQGNSASEIVPLHDEHSDIMFDVSATQLFGHLDLPLLEDANAIQITITNILRALAMQQIDTRKAAVMLYSLQIAVANLKNVRPAPSQFAPIAIADPQPIPQLAKGMLPEDKIEKDEQTNEYQREGWTADAETIAAP